MEKEEILQKSSSKKCAVGEMEKKQMNKGNWIALICAGVLAVTFMIVEGLLRHYEAIYALASVCYIWASVFYTCQFILAKRPWPVLFGAVLEGLAGISMIVLFALEVCGVI